MSFIPEIDGATLILLGSFNPAIFHPDWYDRHGMLSDGEYRSSLDTLKFVTKSFSSFEIGAGGIQLIVSIDQFEMICEFHNHLKMRDLAIGTFRLLEHTPVTAMGINRMIHFSATEEECNNFFERISPSSNLSPLLSNANVRHKSLQFTAARKDGKDGYSQLTIEPSMRVKNFGVYFGVNNHLGRKNNAPLEMDSILEEIEKGWNDRMDFSLKIAESILGG